MDGNILYLTGIVDSRTMGKKWKKYKGIRAWIMVPFLGFGRKSQGKFCWFFEFVPRLYALIEQDSRNRQSLFWNKQTSLCHPGSARPQGFCSQYDLMYFKADAGALAVSARKSEFKIDFERGGQTRKHMMLGKVFGINKLIVTVNKMDGLLSHCTMG